MRSIQKPQTLSAIARNEVNMGISATKCPRCDGKGFIIRNWNGKCKNKMKHIYSMPNGKRSETCLRCGKLKATADNNHKG